MMQSPAAHAAPHALNEDDFKFPPLPSTLTEVLNLITLPAGEQNPDQLIDIVQRDPVTAAHVLKRVNSAFYGMSRQVSHVDRAVTLLGFRAVCNLVLSVGLRQTFEGLQRQEEQLIMAHIMKTSIATAELSRVLATHLQLPLAETAFSAGLLHQIGRLILLYTAPEPYTLLWCERRMEDRIEIATPTLQKEREFFQTDYVAVGAATADAWNLPVKLSTIIAHHRRPGNVEDAHLRALTLAVMAGALEARLLFEATEPEAEGATARPMLGALAKMRNLPPEMLQHVLDEHAGPARRFAEMAVSG